MSNRKTPNFAYGNFATQKDLIGIKRKPCEVSQIVLRTTSLNSDIKCNKFEGFKMECDCILCSLEQIEEERKSTIGIINNLIEK